MHECPGRCYIYIYILYICSAFVTECCAIGRACDKDSPGSASKSVKQLNHDPYRWRLSCLTDLEAYRWRCCYEWQCLVMRLLLLPQVGHYYLRHGGTTGECPFTSCSNADLGEKYVQEFVTTKDGCRPGICANSPEAGYKFATAGYCNVTRCTNAGRGTFYTRGCDVDVCTNGYVRYRLTHISHVCL